MATKIKVRNSLMQAIVTKYIGPTNFRGSRIKATAAAGSITIPYEAALNPTQNHDAAALALANSMDCVAS
jgi:hypothetical protein